MDRVYYLLRDNVNGGPYTIDELIQQKLEKNDLIWIEGKSLAWAYPSEIEPLQMIFKPSKPLEKIVVKSIQPFAASRMYTPPSMSGGLIIQKTNEENIGPVKKRTPEEEIESRAEEIRRRALFASDNHFQYQSAPTEPLPGSSTPLLTDDQIEFKFHSKKKNIVAEPQMVVALLATALVVVGWFGGWTPLNIKKGTMDVVATPFSGSEKAAPVKQILISETENAAKDSSQANLTDSTIKQTVEITANNQMAFAAPIEPIAETTAIEQPEIILEEKEPVQAIKSELDKPVQPKTTKPIVKNTEEDTASKEPTSRNKKDVPDVKEEDEKKKGFLRKLFGKKDKKKDKEDDNQ